jgi:hypothetical protein
MADPESGLSTTRRSTAAQRHRRQMRRRIVGSIGVVLIVVLAALWFSDTLRIPTDGPSFASGADSEQTPAVGGAQRVEGSVDPIRRSLNPLDPLRLWIGGDSLAGALGPSLGRMTGATGVVQPQYDSRISTGLLAGGFDWPEHATEQLEQLDPEVVVFMIGTNDAIIYDDSRAAEYTMKVEEMMKVLIGPGREVYWVNAPVLADEDDEENVLKVDEIQREVAARYSSNVTFVDAHTLFADEQGEYQSSMTDESGKRIALRAGDGIHFTGAGADHLAAEIFELLDANWNIEAQAVPGQTKRVIVTRGSTQVPGSGSSGTGSSSGSGSSNQSFGSNSGNGSSGTTTTIATTPTTAPTASTTPATSPPPPSSTPTSTPPSP